MSTDYAEKEREFIAGLTDDTGRDLGAWMTAIAQSGLNERNAIIDWLRHQGFQFAKASWLERIHHNGGRLIYDSDVAFARHATAVQPHKAVEHPALHFDRAVAVPSPSPVPNLPITDVAPLLATCKGLRPLADHVLREIRRSVENAQIYASPPFILIAAPLPIMALQPNPRMLRLYGDFGPLAGRTKAAEASGRTSPPFSRMLLLDDARDVDEDFHRLLQAAAKR